MNESIVLADHLIGLLIVAASVAGGLVALIAWIGWSRARAALNMAIHEKDLAYAHLQQAHQTQLEQVAAERTQHSMSQEALQKELAELRQVYSTTQQEQFALGQQLRAAEVRVEEGTRHLEDLREDRVQMVQKREALEQLLQEAQAATSESRTALLERDKMLAEQKEHRGELQHKYDALAERFTLVSTELSELKTSLTERDKHYQAQLAQFDTQKNALSEQFKVLANDILEAKTKTLQENSKLSLGAIINPFQQAMENFKKEVQDIHHRETQQQGELRNELVTLKELNQKITVEAHELATALRGQKKLQGNWGELVLENVLDRSGLQPGKDYQREVSITTEEGRMRPDVVVYLPQDKHLVIDSKVSLNAYTRYVNAEEDVERTAALKDHVKAVADRIQELANKDYYRLPGLNSPEMVFMFIPIESAFVEAMKADESVFQQAIEKNVLVATPTTLLTSLNIVRQLWRYEDQNKHTAELARKAESVFKKLNTFLGSFEGIKKGLEKANEAYARAEGQLLSGKGNLVNQVGEFKKLAPAIKAELPEYFTKKAELELEYLPNPDQPEDGIDEAQLTGNEVNSACEAVRSDLEAEKSASEEVM